MNLYTDLAAIDIGTGSIKAAAVEPKDSKTYTVRQLCCEALPQGLIGGDCTNPFISDIEEFKKILLKIYNQIKTGINGVIIGLPDRWVKLTLSQTALTKAELSSNDFLAWRLAKTMPVSEDANFTIEAQVLNEIESAEEPNTYRVLAAGVKTDILNTISSAASELEIEARAFDTSSLGVFNIYEALSPKSVEGKMLLHIHIGHETTVVRAFNDGILIYERVIEVAGEEFTKIIAQLDNLSFKEAEAAKEAEKFFSCERADMKELIAKRGRIEAVFGNWLRELNVTFRFFKEKYSVLTAPEIILTGGSALFSGLSAFVGEYLNTKCTVFNVFEKMQLCPAVSAGPLKNEAARFACCIGLLAK